MGEDNGDNKSIMDMLKPFKDFFKGQKSIIGYGLMCLITIGGQHIFSMVSFNCPCSKDNFFYGMTFLLGPAAVLLILGLFFSTRLWWIYTGCFKCVVPIIWLTAALLNGTFVECAASGLEKYCVNKTEDCLQELVKLPCDKSNGNSKEQLLMFRARSQIIGWWLITLAAFFALPVIFFLNVCSQESYSQRTYCAEKLKEHFDDFVVRNASSLAKGELERFFEKQHNPFAKDSEWIDISPYTFPWQSSENV